MVTALAAVTAAGLIVVTSVIAGSHDGGAPADPAPSLTTPSLTTPDSSGAAPADSGPTSGAGTSAKRPNIVFILTDDFSWNLLSHMRRVRAMQGRGTTFQRYFVVNSLCCPSRAAIFTGAFPHNTGIYTNAGEDGGFLAFRRLGLERNTFATSLKAAGYRTALMGKYLNSYKPDSGYVPPGWTDWAGSDRAYTEYDYNLNENGHVLHFGHQPRAYMTDVLARRGQQFIESSARTGDPFFLELSTFAPHKPQVPAPRHANLFPDLRAPRDASFDRQNDNPPSWLVRRARTPKELADFDSIYRDRVRSVQAVDDMLGRIRATLREQGLDKNTYVVFSSDNGYHLGEHRLLAGKMTAFDSDIRVPLIVTGPGVAKNRTVERIAESIDLDATFTSLAGTKPSALSDGRSLVPLLGGRYRGRWRRAALVEHRGQDLAPDDPDVQAPGSGSTPPTYEAIRLPFALYVEYRNGEREFYDLKRDPAETDNTYALLPRAARPAGDHASAPARVQGPRELLVGGGRRMNRPYAAARSAHAS